MSKVELPWFNKDLSPNSRKHWRVKAVLKSHQRDDAFYAAKGHKPEEAEAYPLNITFYPPDKRHRDIDNCLAAIKSALDGIALSWEVNDKKFKPITVDFGEIVKGGKIIVEVT